MLKIIKAYFTKHPCYATKKRRSIKPKGAMLHCTGAVNRELRRYVDAEGHLGRNQYNNHWNKETATKSVHAFIGYDKDDNVTVAETLPHDVACWGCGAGSKGSYNYDPHAYLQMEICQGSNDDADYYWKAITVAEEYCAHLCKLYGWSAARITSHAEAHKAGYASNHGDPGNWMKHFGDSMDRFRARVAARLKGTETAPDAPVAKDEQIPAPEVGGATAGESGGNSDAQSSKEVYKMKTLKNGSKGTQVRVLQWRLNDMGFDCGAIDGIFGAKTKKAVEACQRANSLEDDGIAGPKTWAVLMK